MGISTAGHLPAITSTSFPTLTSHIVSAFNAQRIGQWSVSIRVFRSIVSSNSNGDRENGEAKQSSTRVKLMYTVQLSEFPEDTFVLIDDTHCDTRAKIRARHAFAVMQAAAAVQQQEQEKQHNEQVSNHEQEGKDDVQLQDKDATQASDHTNTAQSPAQQEELRKEENQDEDLFGAESMTDGQDVGQDSLELVDATPNDETKSKVVHDVQTDQKEDAESNLASVKTDEMDISHDEPLPNTKAEQQQQEQQQQQQQQQSDQTTIQPAIVTPDAGKPTRFTLFAASAHYPLLLSRLNLPAPLGAPSMGDGVSHQGVGGSSITSAGPSAWLPRGQPITIQGAVYDVPSATGYGSGGAEWRVRLGMIQSRGASTQNVGAIVEAEYMPLVRLASDAFLSSYMHNLFPPVITGAAPQQQQHQQPSPTQQAMPGQTPQQPQQPSGRATPAMLGGSGGSGNGIGGIANPVPSPEQWQEIIPASNEAWMTSVGISGGGGGGGAEQEMRTILNPSPLQQKDPVGWRGKERGRRLAYLYITLLRNQSVI